MNVLNAIENRRAVKHFDASHRMSENEIATLMNAALLSPTSFNIQNWRFVVVLDPEQRKKLRAAGWDQAQITDASLLIVLCGDPKSWNKEPQRYWRNAPQEVQDFLVPALVNFYDSRGEQTQRDEVMRSTGMAAQTIMLAAQEMGYDTCPMVGFDPAEVAKIINLPSDHIVSMMIAVGKSTQPARSRGGAIDPKEAIVRDRFAA